MKINVAVGVNNPTIRINEYAKIDIVNKVKLCIAPFRYGMKSYSIVLLYFSAL